MSCRWEAVFSVCVTRLACFGFRPEAFIPDLMASAPGAANAQEDGDEEPSAALEPNVDDLVGVSVQSRSVRVSVLRY